jgi:tetratricopeptide (TPR) repeat protein
MNGQGFSPDLQYKEKRVSKKRSKKKPGKKKAARDESVNFDPRLVEETTADLHRLLKEQDFATIDEAKAFINDLLASPGPLPSKPPSTPLGKAQDLIYDAWDSSGLERLELARDALDISEDCADAWVLLAEEAAGSLHEARVFYEAGVKAGEKALGQDTFEQHAGHFWVVFETRPYMRARAGLAGCLWDLGNHVEAIDHLGDMLRLNPNDNQGIRYMLLTYLLEDGPQSAVDELLSSYDDGSANWLYSQALHTFRNQGASSTARKHLQAALKSNSHVPAYLLLDKTLPKELPDMISHGDEDEAAVYVVYNGHLWIGEEGALDWMQRISKAS